VVGDGKPFVAALITLDAEVLGPWKERHGKPADASIASLRDDPDLVAAVQAAVNDANQAVSRAESIRKFRILDVDFTQEAGQLTVKLGIRRSVLLKDFAADIEALYSLGAKIADRRAAGSSSRHSRSTHARPFSPMALAFAGSPSNSMVRAARLAASRTT